MSAIDAALLEATEAGDTQRVKAALTEGANVHCMDSYGAMPLHLAAFKGHVEVAAALLDSGAHVDATSKYGIHRAALCVSQRAVPRDAAAARTRSKFRRFRS